MLGQEATIAILREYVQSGRGFQQSYLFCGGHGSGKTTLGRILARALLCEATQNGDPCNECHSCKGLLKNGTSADFVEVDAATNSGKADITKITEEVAYATLSGKRRIYLFDESHQLSKEALNALLKYLEDTFPGSDDKKLTCIFCTTEPEKMKATILSRCAPAFVVQAQKPEHIAGRLAAICTTEGIPFEPDMLRLIAELTEYHIRDAMKAVEGVSMLGQVNRVNVTAYLHLDLNTAYINLLKAIGVDLKQALDTAKTLMQRISPTNCYGKLAEVAMLAYQVHLGDTATGAWSPEALQVLSTKGEALLGYAARFASRPGRPTTAMLLMDIASLHYVGGQVRSPTMVLQVVSSSSAPPSPTQPQPPLLLTSIVDPSSSEIPAEAPAMDRAQVIIPPKSPVWEMDPSSGTVAERDMDWVIPPKMQGKREGAPPTPGGSQSPPSTRSPHLSPAAFIEFLAKSLAEKDLDSG